VKIVQLVTRNCVGGVQVVAQALDAGFRSAGHDSSVWFFCDTDEETLPVLNSHAIFAARPARFYYPRLLARLFLQLRREKPDVVIAHTTNTAVPGLLLAALAGIAKRVAVQHNPLDTYSAMARNADRLCAETGIYRRNVTVANAVTETMSGYSARAAARVRMIHNGLKEPASQAELSKEQRADLRRRFGLPADQPVIATIGRLAKQKNQGVLIEAMRSLESIVLAIAGEGTLRERLLAQVAAAGLEQRVYMLGALGAADVRLLLRISDIFVTPSHFEAMPMVVLEAMQEGSVIVASDIEAHRELLGESGRLVAPTPDGVQAAVRELLADASLCAQLSRAALERSRQFSEKAMIEGYLRLLSES
jgi:glycosyltransferase involved in cell wall biosynthesis